ncbi:VIT1/CCC1 transporter family protein [Novosphingobium flavum]|uniref:VIT1/CCC1 transporter family protein n=1 Tax=Novosphingobium flavum TaxID=1778672 RepID=A0A7X1KKI8_9SPHN|nr:VIT1/CCC1 transporter family protein [Novosphingobium flavum]MBC2664318.1 VIT1/CCC1 transporter family protein [Novosphingobium flavum]
MIEQQAEQRLCWLSGAVFIANGGIMALAGLIAGVAAAAASESEVLVAGVGGLVAGAIAVASAAYGAAMARTDGRLPAAPEALPQFHSESDLNAIAAVYRGRGLSEQLAQEAALAAMRPYASVRAGDEARPVEAALSAASSFATGAAVPVTLASLFSLEHMTLGVGAASGLVAVVLAVLAARGSRAGLGRVALRVALACAAVVIVGQIVGNLMGTALA